MNTSRFTFIVAAVLCCALVAAGYDNYRLREMCRDLNSRRVEALSDAREMKRHLAAYGDEVFGQADSLDPLQVRADNHLPDKPVFIFDKLDLGWNELAPEVELIYGENVEYELFGSFPVSCSHLGSDVADVVVDENGIELPDYGEHYLHTSIGFFKILAISPDAGDDERIFQIARFVSGNSIHSLADVRQLIPVKGVYNLQTPEKLLQVLFTSDQPLKLHCGPISNFLQWMLQEQGYECHRVQFGTKDGQGHVAAQAWFPEAQKEVFIDTDYGVMVKNRDGGFLSIVEVTEFVKDENFEALRFVNIGRKGYVPRSFNSSEPTPSFNWSPAINVPDKKYFTRESYLSTLKKYTHKVSVAKN